MADRPILFSGPMVRALLDGRKTQTRRALNPQPSADARYTGVHYASDEPASWFFNSPTGPEKIRERYTVGDRLWLREAWRTEERNDYIRPRDLRIGLPTYYEAAGGGEEAMPECAGRLRPGIHMPRWASRLTLLVSDVRVQRLHDIGEDDAIAEGAGHYSSAINLHRDRPYDPSLNGHYREGFSELWEGLNAKRGFGWAANPWVCALTFTVHRRNIDAMEAENG